MSDVRLNLARKWRAKGFDQIIGQDLTVRTLKNSLFLGNYFPVYLLWGQRGSGKTSTARVFVSALNCECLDTFRKDPKGSSIPCLECNSCRAMIAGKHPDFIEMDAASHTGVDNVRQIIDAASLMPLLGKKKIYLIDEAHMLSKAAFNAFLKILEEPPASVLFMLATTDPEKIIDTVKSRCFQLFFKPVAADPLCNHLENICKSEDIEYDSHALSMIAKETGGSVRDAINLLEQVRFAVGSVNKDGIINVLGHIDDERLLHLLDILLSQGTTTLLPFLEDLNIRLFSAEYLWGRLISLIRAALWLKHDIEPQHYQEHIVSLRAMIQRISIKRLTSLLERFYKQEQLFLKTTDKHLFLEILLLQACQHNDTPTNSTTAPASASPPGIPSLEEEEEEYIEYIEEEEEDEEEDDEGEADAQAPEQASQKRISANPAWDDFLVSIMQLEDPLLNSIFKQGTYSGFDGDTKTITVEFSKEFVFFNEWLENSCNVWHPLLEKVFGEATIFNPMFTLEGKGVSSQEHTQTASNNSDGKQSNGAVAQRGSLQRTGPKPAQAYNGNGAIRSKQPYNNVSNRTTIRRSIVDVSDADYWKKAHMLLQHFPGIVREY